MQTVLYANKTLGQALSDPADLNNHDGQGASPGESGVQKWRHKLATIVSSEIVPRLLTMQQASNASSAQIRACSPHDVTELVDRLRDHDPHAACGFLRTLQVEGVPGEAILLDLLTSAARSLGDLWTQDSCDFVEVSIGLHRLHNLMEELGDLPGLRDCGPAAPRALLVAAPGETHEFGIAMVGRFFRSEGWNVQRCPAAAALRRLSDKAFDVLGISVSCGRFADPLAPWIAEARRLSRNASVKIILGGAAVLENPELAQKLGADGTACDAKEAVQLARSLVDAGRLCESH